MKLQKLTKEQKKLMFQVRDEWLDYIFSCKNQINREQAEKGINWMYQLSGLDKPLIVWLDSPMGLQIGANMLSQILSQDLKRASVGAYVWASVEASVAASVHASVGDSVGASEMQYYPFSSYGSVWDYGWVSFYDFFQRINIFKNHNFNEFKSLLQSGIYDMIQLKGICLVCGLPSKIERNEKGRLHNETSHAIEFRDGYKLCFWKGTCVPEKLIMHPDSITKEDLKQSNTETRRCYIEKLGVSKYFDLLSEGRGLNLIDEDKDNQGFPMKLVEFDFEGDKIQCLEVVCPSTDRTYNLYPPNQKSANVWEAKASTFNLKQEEFKPVYES